MKHNNKSKPVLAAAQPQKGDKVYVPPVSFCRGFDDHTGGLATVIDVTVRRFDGQEIIGVAVDVSPNTHFDWFELCGMQKELEQQFGEHPAIAGPILLSA